MVLEPFQEDFKLLVEGGFTSLYQGDFPSSRALFDAARLLRPEHTAPYYGYLYLHLHSFEFPELRSMAEKIMELDSQDHAALALMGLSYALEKKEVDTGLDLMEKAVRESNDPILVQLKADVLAWLAQQKLRLAAR